MSIIKFSLCGERGKMLRLTALENGGERVRIEIDGAERGILSIADRKLMLKNGEATVKLSDIRDGYIKPMLITDGQIICAEGFVKSGCELYTAENALAQRAALGERIKDLEYQLSNAENEISRLNKAVSDGYTFTLK